MAHPIHRFRYWLVLALALGNHLTAQVAQEARISHGLSYPAEYRILVYNAGVLETTEPAVSVPAGVIAVRDVTVAPGFSKVIQKKNPTAVLVGQSYVGSAGTPAWTDVHTVNSPPPLPPGSPAIVHNVDITPSRAPTPDTGKTLWEGEDGTLTSSLYREGVDKIVYAVNENTRVTQTAGGGGGGGGGSTANIEAFAEAQLDFSETQTPTSAAMQEAGGTAKTQIAELFGPNLAAPAAAPTGSAPTLSVVLPAAFSGRTIDLNPFRSDRLGPISGWFKQALHWLVLVLLGVWVWKEIGEWTRGFSSIKQAQGNAVLGGTGAQATALLAAGIITTAVIVAATALLSWSFGGVDLSVFRTLTAETPLQTLGAIASGALWMLQQILPVETIVVSALARLSFNIYAAPLFAGLAALVRFIVP